MENDKKNRDEYPKMSGNDKRWKNQDEFDSAGLQQQREDENQNESITKAAQDRSGDDNQAENKDS